MVVKSAAYSLNREYDGFRIIRSMAIDNGTYMILYDKRGNFKRIEGNFKTPEEYDVFSIFKNCHAPPNPQNIEIVAIAIPIVLKIFPSALMEKPKRLSSAPIPKADQGSRTRIKKLLTTGFLNIHEY